MGRREGGWGRERSEEERGEACAPGSPFKSLIITLSMGLHYGTYSIYSPASPMYSLREANVYFPEADPTAKLSYSACECCSQSLPSQHEDVDVSWMSANEGCRYLHTRDNVILTQYECQNQHKVHRAILCGV